MDKASGERIIQDIKDLLQRGKDEKNDLYDHTIILDECHFSNVSLALDEVQEDLESQIRQKVALFIEDSKREAAYTQAHLNE